MKSSFLLLFLMCFAVVECAEGTSTPFEKGTFIFNVFRFGKTDILILQKALSSDSNNRLRITIQMYNNNNLVKSYTKDTCAGQSGIPYFATDKYLVLLICNELYVYNGNSDSLGIYIDSDPYGLVYIRNENIYREYTPGFGQSGAGTIIDIKTLKKIKDYKIDSTYLPDEIKKVEDIELKPADLASKIDLIVYYETITKLKFWGE